ncbi:MAG: CoA pyrophosphatase [Bacteroidota bacterium]|nr:CoA pyrophosphatase [Bacteroidota bacterium]
MTNQQFISQLKQRLKNTLPGWKTQQNFMPLKGLPNISYKSKNTLRKGAVLACLYEDNNELMTILIERTQDTSPHSGQIAFPGGKHEEFDENQIETAFREAEEEVGLKPNELELLGQLSPIEIPISGFTILPVVAWHKGIPNLIGDPHEVASLIQTPLLPLIKSLRIKEIPVREYQVTTPCFFTQKHIVWGATAMVIGELQEIIREINPSLIPE